MSIRYEKFFSLLKQKNITLYRLRRDKVVGTETLEKMRKGVGHIDTRSIERLCRYLDCQPGDLMEYRPGPDLGDGEASPTNPHNRSE